MANLLRISISARIELDHGNEISRLSTLKYIPLEDELIVIPAHAIDLVTAIDEKLGEWMQVATQLEREHRELQRIPPERASRPYMALERVQAISAYIPPPIKKHTLRKR